MNKELLEDALELLVRDSGCDPRFEEALRYALFPGGKRIRPRIFLAASSDLAPGGSIGEAHFRIGAALEALHCATLIHDDLPALDNDAMRRGRPSLHVAFGEATAILVGDYLPLRALSALSDGGDPALAKISAELGAAYATVCHGQFLDLDPALRRCALPEIHRQKTGPFFRAALRSAAIMGGASSHVLAAAGAFGEHLGIFFQTADDYLDRYGSAATRGRERRSDQENDRMTDFSGLHGEDAERMRARVVALNDAQQTLCEVCEIAAAPALDLLISEIVGALDLP